MSACIKMSWFDRVSIAAEKRNCIISTYFLLRWRQIMKYFLLWENKNLNDDEE